jgi:hypothetical protein
VPGVSVYYEIAVRGTEHEDMLVIFQDLRKRVGQKFSFLNYYKEIPVSYDATLLNVDNNMAEFAVHEYQAKVINLEKITLIRTSDMNSFKDDLIGEVFYVNSAKKRAIFSKFGYVHILSNLRQYVRVQLDSPVEAELIFEEDILKGNVRDLSLGGAAIRTMSADLMVPGLDMNIIFKVPNFNGNSVQEIGIRATIIKVVGTTAPYTCLIELHAEKHSLQQIAYYVNQRQVEIIKELKELNA